MQMERNGTGPRETFCSFVDQPENRVLGRRYGIGVRNGCKSKPSEFEWLLLFRGWVLISSGGSCSVLFRSFCLAFFSLRIKMSRFLSLPQSAFLKDEHIFWWIPSRGGMFCFIFEEPRTYLRWKSNGGNLREDRNIPVSSHARLKMRNLGHYSILSLFFNNILHVPFDKSLANTQLAIAQHRLPRKRTQSNYARCQKTAPK